MPFEAFKYRILTGLFEMAGNVISSQLTKPDYEKQGKQLSEYYDQAKEIVKKTKPEKKDRRWESKELNLPPLSPVLPKLEITDLTEKVSGGTACLPCIPPDAMIYTNPECKTIDSLVVGDKVLDAHGDWTEIRHIFNNPYSGLVYDIFVQYQNTPLTITPEHPILVSDRKTQPIYLKPGEIKDKLYLLFPRILQFEDIECISVDKYVKKQYVITDGQIQRISKNNYKKEGKIIKRVQKVGKPIKNKILLNNKLMKLFGFYLAEGHITKWTRGSGIRFSFGKHEIKYISYVSKAIENCFGLKPKIVEKKTGINVEIYSELLADMFSELFGNNSHTKKIPKWVIYLPMEKQESLLEGYYLGDGYIRKKKYNNISCTTVSNSLVNSLRIILARHGIIASYSVKEQKDTHIKDRVLHSNGLRYILDCGGKSASKLIKIVDPTKLKEEFNISHGAFLDENYIYYPIKKIHQRKYDGNVMNLETESHNYVANGLIVGNCSRDHFSTVSGALGEAIRFSRKDGITNPEVQRRFGMSLDELNMLERIDLAPEEMVQLKGREKELAEWGLNKSRELRHKITAIQNHEDLEKVAAEAAEVRTKFMKTLWETASMDGSIDKLCKGLKDEERERCITTINAVLHE